MTALLLASAGQRVGEGGGARLRAGRTDAALLATYAGSAAPPRARGGVRASVGTYNLIAAAAHAACGRPLRAG
jgi:hypothetical protein